MMKYLLLIGSLIFLVTACEAYRGIASGEAQQGVIVNADTGEPIPNVFVIANWSGRTGTMGGGGSVCFHVEVTTTDEQGRYHIPAWKEKNIYANSAEQKVLVFAYKPGYRWPYRKITGMDVTVKMIESQETSMARIDYLNEVHRNTSCSQAGESRKNNLQLYKVLYKDAVSTADTREGKVSAISILLTIEGMELGGVEANKRFYERLDKLK